MASLSQCRALAGAKAFTGIRPRAVSAVSGAMAMTMKRKDSYMVEVNVGEDEPEDIAVRKFMKKVVESRVIEQLRARRYKETPLEEYKRRTRERIERIKLRILEPTWEEEYANEPYEVKPFEEFFSQDPDNETGFVNDLMQYQDQEYAMAGQGAYMNDANAAGGAWGGYVNSPNAARGGYMNAQQGGYMN